MSMCSSPFALRRNGDLWQLIMWPKAYALNQQKSKGGKAPSFKEPEGKVEIM